MRSKIMPVRLVLIVAALLPLRSAELRAASRWYTARTFNGRTQPLSAGTETMHTRDGLMPVTAALVSNALIDVTISLYCDPRGDDDGNTQDVDPASAGQDAYERIIQYFADGLYESTEGVHALRNVRIYRNASRQDADIIWEETGGPRAGLMNQDGIAANISMFNHFSGAVFTNAADHEAGGYVLAHEMGHYFYGLLDEYCRWDGGIYPVRGAWANLPAADKTAPCIMNSQWEAEDRRYRWLNHSIAVDADTPFAHYESRPRTAQRQFYGAGGWPTLARHPDDDPLDTADRRGLRDAWGKRYYYPEIAAVAPAGTNAPSIDLSRHTPLDDLPSRQHLNVIWMSSNIVVMIVLDKSGSMQRFDRLVNAKIAAKMLVDQIPEGSAVGVMAFNDEVEIISPLGLLENPAQRQAVKDAIDGITPSGWSAIGTAADAALEHMRAFGRAYWTRGMFLLSDGQSNTGPDPLSAIAGLQNEQIPVMAFGFGAEEEIDARLPQLAALTGGRYRYAPDGLFDITAAFGEAMGEMTARHVLAQSVWSPAPGGPRSGHPHVPFQVDDTLAGLEVQVGHAMADTVALVLRAPDGVSYAPVATNQVAAERVLSFEVAAPLAGLWHITGSATGALRYRVQARAQAFTFCLTAVSRGGDTLAFPRPLHIAARLTRNAAVAGAVVRATVTDPAGAVTVMDLEATAPGAYAGLFVPRRNGRHTVVVAADNSAGAAEYSWEAEVYSATRDGGLPPVRPNEPVAEDFTRSVAFQVSVTGVAQAPLPPAPAGLTVSRGDFAGYVRLAWQDVADASLYEIWRADDAHAAPVMIAAVDRVHDNYMDGGVAPGSTSHYRVRAVNHAGAGEFSAPAEGWPLFGPAIRVNAARSAVLSAGALLDLTVLLVTGQYTGTPCDWWVAAHDLSRDVFYFLDENMQWRPAADLGDLRPVYTGPIFDIGDPYTVLRMRNPPPGHYRFYFALDWTPNGVLDWDTLYFEQPVTELQVR